MLFSFMHNMLYLNYTYIHAIWIIKWWWVWVTEPKPVYLSSFRKLFLFFTNLSAINFVLHFLNEKKKSFFCLKSSEWISFCVKNSQTCQPSAHMLHLKYFLAHVKGIFCVKFLHSKKEFYENFLTIFLNSLWIRIDRTCG